MEKVIDFGKMCRICLSQNDCIDMTDQCTIVINTKQWDNDEELESPIPIKNAFFYFSSLRDCISQAPIICGNCANELASAYDFAMKVQQSDKRIVDVNMLGKDLPCEYKLVECDEDMDLSNSSTMQIRNSEETTNTDGYFDENIVTIEEDELDDDDEDDDIDGAYAIKSPCKVSSQKNSKLDSNTYVAVPQYTVNSQHDGIDTSDIFPTKEQTSSFNVKTIDVAAVHVAANDSFDFNSSILNDESDKDSMYLCKYCPKAFASPHHLIVHTKKSHVCQFCLKGFRLSSDLYEHIRTHKDFRCHICKKNFNSNSNLRSHLRKIHDIKLPANVSLLTVADTE